MAEEHDDNTGKKETTPTPDGGNETVTMTQAAFDAKFNESFGKGAAKGGNTATTELLASIGVDDIDVLKSIVTTHQENQEADKTELQKMQDLLEAERLISTTLEGKLNANIADTEIQTLALANGINPDKMKYFKMDYAEAKNVEGFNVDTFISALKEKQPDFFGFVDERKVHVPNPQSKHTPSSQIKMPDYSKLSAVERAKYKASDIIR